MNGITLVTGGTGFIGSHLVESLIQEGRHVRCLVRKTSDLTHLKRLGAEIYFGDLLDEESLKRVAKNVNVVYHLAAQVRPHKAITRRGELLELYKRVNFLGTKYLVDACFSEGVSKFIFFSTIAVLGIGSNMKEETPGLPITDYGKSKLACESYILTLCRNNNFPGLIIRPGQIYGPRCLAMIPLFKLIKHGIFVTIGNGANWIPACYVDDLIRGAFLVEERGKLGSTYFIFEKCYRFREYAEIIAGVTEGYLSKLYCPKSLAYAVVNFKEAIEKAVHLKICPFCMDLGKSGIISFSSNWFGNIDKARTELGYAPIIDLKKGIELTANWYKNACLL